MALTKVILNKRFALILEMFIDSYYEADEQEKDALQTEACEELDQFTDEFNLEEDWKDIIEFTGTYIDQEQKEHETDISPIKQMITSLLEW